LFTSTSTFSPRFLISSANFAPPPGWPRSTAIAAAFTLCLSASRVATSFKAPSDRAARIKS
jgi:hypothetical protein